ncbi:hypothetical protein M8494_23945 [Serratia ureilytica]
MPPTLIIWFLIPVPERRRALMRRLLALFIGTIIAIIGKAMPIGAVSVIAIAGGGDRLCPVSKPGAALDDALGFGFSTR